MKPIKITRSQARRFLLAYQYLWPPRNLCGKGGVLKYFNRVRCVQYDPLDRVGYNSDLVLQSRICDYRPSMLQELLYQDRRLLDGFDKVMSIWPVEDWPYFQRRRASHQDEIKSREAVDDIIPSIREEIKTRGPLSSRNLDYGRKVDWWWAPTSLARAALESMYYRGELIVHHKVLTQKVYDLSERHIPPEYLNANEPNPTETEYFDWYLLRRISSVGLVWDRTGEIWLSTPFKSADRRLIIQRLLNQEKVLELHVDGINVPMYIKKDESQLLSNVRGFLETPIKVSFLAPLDNLLWDRRLLEALFDYQYRWEVYVPSTKRKYGYYVVPVLFGDRFIARFEPVRNKKSGILNIKNWWWETNVPRSETLMKALCECFLHFKAYLNVRHIHLRDHCFLSDDVEGLVNQLVNE